MATSFYASMDGSDPAFTYVVLRGAEIEPWLDELGRLRIRVFREFPYLYDGDLDYERKYLERYRNSPGGLVVLLQSGAQVVGATTCLPMADETAEFQEPFRRAGYDLNDVFYFGESVILAPYRGRGAGREFFRRREAHARNSGAFRYTVFCAVDRPANHPARPRGYRPLDAFWTEQGYLRQPGLRCEFSWKETTEAAPTRKSLTFWMKDWA